MDACNSIIEARHGGVIGSRATRKEIYSILEPCLSPSEREFLPAPDSIEAGSTLDLLRISDLSWTGARKAPTRYFLTSPYI